jgi:RNA polymerase sigma-70 factor, ECF subfamily
MWDVTSSTELLGRLGAGADDVLIARCLGGDDLAPTAVYNRYAPTIYRLCVGILNHREDAEEVLQDTFEYAFRRLGRFDPGRASFKTWLYQIAISRCRNKRRRRWLATVALGQMSRTDLEDHEAQAPPAAAHETERRAAVWQALSELSPKLREAAVLRYYGGLTYAEMGQALGVPSKTAASRVRLAHRALRARLAGLLDGEELT